MDAGSVSRSFGLCLSLEMLFFNEKEDIQTNFKWVYNKRLNLPERSVSHQTLSFNMVSRKETVKSCCVNILDDVKRILAQPFECRKTSLPDGALHNVQKELENMINAIDKDIYSFTPSYGKYLIDCWLGDELVDKLLDVSCQYEKLIKLK